MRMADLSRIGERARLKPRAGDEPHWHRLRAGSFVGYRPSKRGGRGTWFARAYDADAGKYLRKPLGDFGTAAGNEVFAQAKREAEAWAESVEAGGIRAEKVETVADACRSYLKGKPRPEANGKRARKTIAEGVFDRHVFDDPVAKVRLDKLRRHHLKDWRSRLEQAPALLSRSKNGEVRTKERAKSTVNRDMVPLRAALRMFMTPGAPGTDAAWQEALKPHRGADRRRGLYVDLAERKRLLAAADAVAAPFLRALCLLPLRPGAVAALRVADFDGRTRSLTIGKDKNGQPRQISVPGVVADFVGEQAKCKLPDAWLFSRTDGAPWNRNTWKGPIREAASAANLPSGVTAYTLRHSVITDLVRGGLPILTVAQLSGTSVAMIERHYGHLVRDDAEQALARLAI